MLLKIGSTGEDVKKLQEKLGVDAGSAAGTFGPKTEAAVKTWQKANGLLDDGIVGPKTWELMFPLVIPESPFKLKNLVGHIPGDVIVQIPDTAAKFNITNTLRLTHFLAQCAHESGNWRYRTELASGAAYEGRKDLGNTQAGDGVKFKGRGYIQLTGRANYKSFSNFVGVDCVANPELVATTYPMMSAAFFFNSNNLWTICDRGATDDIITLVTRRVNGGTNGLADRLKHFKEYYPLLA
jgi:putative chitinase